MDRITTENMRFVDALGRERIFHGLNLVFKGESCSGQTNYIPPWNETLFQWLFDHGFNVVRLGMVWDALEPEPGQIDQTYLNWIERMLDLAEQHGIYVYLDMHQDLFSCRFSDGAPDWATMTDGLDHVTGELWSDAYLFSPAVQRAFDSFWANRRAADGIGLLDHFANLWVSIAHRFQDHNALLGFDFLNEPHPGEEGRAIVRSLIDAYIEKSSTDSASEDLLASLTSADLRAAFLRDLEDPEFFSAVAAAAQPMLKRFDQQTLGPFYQRLADAVTPVCPDKIIMMENSYFSNLGIECSIPRIQGQDPRGPVEQAYAPHGYDLVVDTPHVVNASNARAGVIFGAHRRVQERLAVPVMVGEWGAHGMHADGLDHIRFLLDTFDAFQWSHTYWCYQPGMESAPVMDVLCRPYPQAVCGSIKEYGFDDRQNRLRVVWDDSGSPGLESIIYLHRRPQRINLKDAELRPASRHSDGFFLHIPSRSETNRALSVQF